jgi:hypothetical protein
MLATLQASPITHLTFPLVMVWAAIVGIFAPLPAYIINTKLWKNAPETVKSLVTTLVAAIGGGVTMAITTNTFGINGATLEVVLTSILLAFGAHTGLWKLNTVQAKLTKG